MTKAEPRILILTLYSGENELNQCIEAVEEQTYACWEHSIIRNLPNVEAHQTLYRTIMEKAGEYSLFIKLDADMVFRKNTALQEIVNAFVAEPEMDHAVFSVRDWYSNTCIIGMNVYSPRVRWKIGRDRIFVDSSPELMGIRKLYWDEPAPIADHSPDPSLKEAFLFGFHRATKVVQRDRWIKHVSQARFQLDLLANVWQQFTQEGDVRRGVAVYGAETVLSGRSEILEDKAEAVCESELDNVRDLGAIGLERLLRSRWSSGNFLRKWRTFRFVDGPHFVNAVLMSAAKIPIRNQISRWRLNV